MNTSTNKFENYSNFNNEKRLHLIKSYNQSVPFTSDTSSNTCHDLQEQFNTFIISHKHNEFSQLQTEHHLIDTIIQYSLLHLEEFDYNLKLKGLHILDHLIEHSTNTQINFNMRSQLVYNCLERYITDKENLTFLNSTLQTMCLLLNVIEIKSKCSEHSFRNHSVVIEILLNNCYMTTNLPVKLVYYTNYVNYLKQIGPYSCRHLDKLLTVVFDSVDCGSEASLDLVNQESILLKCFDLIELIIEICSERVHIHARRIINFLTKLAYLAGLSVEENSDLEKLTSLDFIERLRGLLEKLFKNDKAKNNLYNEFKNLKNLKNINPIFLKMIEAI